MTLAPMNDNRPHFLNKHQLASSTILRAATAILPYPSSCVLSPERILARPHRQRNYLHLHLHLQLQR